MKQIKTKYKEYFTNKKFILSTILGFVFLFAALIINFYAGTYATKNASNPVTDIILSNIRVYDVDGFFIYGSFLFATILALVCFYRPNKIPYILKSIALFTTIRSIFITLTHLGPSPLQTIIQSDILSKMSFGGDLFFSGHTGLPFLLALIFWHNKLLRYIFIFFSLMFAIVVLLAHLHYSIDVLAAFFITYTVFHMGEFLFKNDKKSFFDKN